MNCKDSPALADSDEVTSNPGVDNAPVEIAANSVVEETSILETKVLSPISTADEPTLLTSDCIDISVVLEAMNTAEDPGSLLESCVPRFVGAAD